MSVQKIIPSLWCAGDPDQMVSLYERAFEDVRRRSTSHYPTEGLLDFQKDMAGAILTIEFSVFDYVFVLVNGGPAFTPNPSVSFMVRFSDEHFLDPEEALRAAWDVLIDGGKALMPLGTEDLGSLFGWVEDKFGISWQLMLEDDPENEVAAERPRVHPALLFGAPAFGKAAVARERYLEVFPHSRIGITAQSPADGSLAFGDAQFGDDWLAFQDAEQAPFAFNEAVSFIINCTDQQEIDYFWEALSRVPESEQCGWCKDEFGVSWQVTPLDMEDLTSSPDAYAAMMGMKKIDLNVLKSFK